jgi:hypothetical protein
MRHKLFCASCMVAVAVTGAAPAYADNLHGFGCGTGTGALAATSAPGNSATSPGSPKNEPGMSSLNGGKGGQAYNSARQGAGAPSNYDTSCGKVTANGTGTPIQTLSPLPTQIPNNSLATRTANGVISHTGKGATK